MTIRTSIADRAHRSPRLLLLPLALWLAACTSLQPQRSDPRPCAAGQACDQSMIEHADAYQLGYVQFDDDGAYAQAGQLDHVIGDIRANATSGLILVSFTHGWKEDSGDKRLGVQSFRSMLAATATREQQLATLQARDPRRVAGVFLGWPGHTRMLPGFSGLTWFNREDAAIRIAHADYGDALLRLQQLRDSTPAGAASNQLIHIGHSLGAAMLYQRIVRDPLRNTGTIRAPVADLVLLLSPAIAVTELRTLDSMSAADRQSLPPIMAITAEGDRTLRLAFPFGQWLENPSQVAEQPLQRQAIGLHAPLITHRLAVNKQALGLSPTGTRAADAGMLQIAASPDVMQGHKDIRNPRLLDFIAEVVSLQTTDALNRAALAQAFPVANSP